MRRLTRHDAGTAEDGAVIFSLESAVSLLRAPSERLTSTEELITIGRRLLGPLFFGLALLALRGRVKR